jgi:hypothetical protein
LHYSPLVDYLCNKQSGYVGTSSQMRAKNYQGLVSHKEALAFFGIMPGL